MAIPQRINSLLNYELKINLDKKINRSTAIAIIGVFVVVLAAAGYFAGDRFIWSTNKNVYENQIDSLKESLKKQPKSNDTRAEIALANYLNGDIAKSTEMLRNILSEEPGNRVAALYLGLILAEQKEYKQSINLLTGYIKQNRGLEARIAYLYLGRDYLAAGQYKPALEALNEAALRDPGNPVVYYNLGQVYEKLNDKKRAKQSYEKALKIARDYVEADIALKSLLKN